MGKKEEKAKDEEFQEPRKGNVLMQRVIGLGLEVDDLKITFDDGIATINGKTQSQAEREKVVLAVGNTEGVGQVDDRIVVVKRSPRLSITPCNAATLSRSSFVMPLCGGTATAVGDYPSSREGSWRFIHSKIVRQLRQ